MNIIKPLKHLALCLWFKKGGGKEIEGETDLNI